jgi:hypothetical protein
MLGTGKPMPVRQPAHDPVMKLFCDEIVLKPLCRWAQTGMKGYLLMGMGMW